MRVKETGEEGIVNAVFVDMIAVKMEEEELELGYSDSELEVIRPFNSDIVPKDVRSNE